MASSVANGKSVPENKQHMLKRKQVLNDNVKKNDSAERISIDVFVYHRLLFVKSGNLEE